MDQFSERIHTRHDKQKGKQQCLWHRQCQGKQTTPGAPQEASQHERTRASIRFEQPYHHCLERSNECRTECYQGPDHPERCSECHCDSSGPCLLAAPKGSLKKNFCVADLAPVWWVTIRICEFWWGGPKGVSLPAPISTNLRPTRRSPAPEVGPSWGVSCVCSCDSPSACVGRSVAG